MEMCGEIGGVRAEGRQGRERERGRERGDCGWIGGTALAMTKREKLVIYKDSPDSGFKQGSIRF